MHSQSAEVCLKSIKSKVRMQVLARVEIPYRVYDASLDVTGIIMIISIGNGNFGHFRPNLPLNDVSQDVPPCAFPFNGTMFYSSSS
jgi:hypothetical protein